VRRARHWVQRLSLKKPADPDATGRSLNALGVDIPLTKRPAAPARFADLPNVSFRDAFKGRVTTSHGARRRTAGAGARV